jgi:hypothetical protein
MNFAFLLGPADLKLLDCFISLLAASFLPLLNSSRKRNNLPGSDEENVACNFAFSHRFS